MAAAAAILAPAIVPVPAATLWSRRTTTATGSPAMPIKRVIAPTVKELTAGTWSNCLVVDGVAYVAEEIGDSHQFQRWKFP